MVGPLSLVIVAVFRRPKRIPKRTPGRLWHDKRPDLDNVLKAVLDAGTNAGLWLDDAQVVELLVRSVYAAAGEEPHVTLIVAPLTGPPR
jgi:crossover junction endodeoxyribonuclease RusA